MVQPLAGGIVLAAGCSASTLNCIVGVCQSLWGWGFWRRGLYPSIPDAGCYPGASLREELPLHGPGSGAKGREGEGGM